MTHNDIVKKIEEKITVKQHFWYFFPKGIGKQMPFDVLFIVNNNIHCIEVKRVNRDSLRLHQKYWLNLAQISASNVHSWVVEGDFKKNGKTIPNYARLKNISGKTILAGSYQSIVFLLENHNTPTQSSMSSPDRG